MRALRVVLLLLLATSAVAVITRVLLPRIECNLAKGAINRDVRNFSRTGDDYQRALRAQRNIAKCQKCLAIFPEDHQLYMLLAANLRILGRYDDAIRTFEQALALAERPEIYAQIGEVEIERGNVEAARRALVKAATFNIVYVETVDQPLRDEVYAEVFARHARLQAAKQ
jgi:tetratricopeptide (TPR) repeat protein